MMISEMMSRNVQTISPNATIKQAAQDMKRSNVSLLPVCLRDQLLGTLSDRDIALRAVAEGWDPNRVKVKEIMTEDIVTCREGQDVQEAARLMEERRLDRILVVDEENRPVGIFSIADLALEVADERMAGAVVRCVSEAFHHRR